MEATLYDFYTVYTVVKGVIRISDLGSSFKSFIGLYIFFPCLAGSLGRWWFCMWVLKDVFWPVLFPQNLLDLHCLY